MWTLIIDNIPASGTGYSLAEALAIAAAMPVTMTVEIVRMPSYDVTTHSLWHRC